MGRYLNLASACLAAVALAGLGCTATGAAAPIPGAELYRACVNCHGPAAAGSQTIGAPRIAGLPQWYVARELHDFQDGLRGKHPDDSDGLRMRAMAMQLMSAEEITAVAGYVSSLPPVRNPKTFPNADLAAGQAVFTRCAACHGPHGEGNQQLNAPPLAGLDDWYVARQNPEVPGGRPRQGGGRYGRADDAGDVPDDPARGNRERGRLHQQFGAIEPRGECMSNLNPDPEAVGRFLFLATAASAIAFAIVAYFLVS